MKIGYRRGAGKLPLTANEKGARGTWLEKRTAFLNALHEHGHEVLYWSEPTPNSAQAGHSRDLIQPVELLIIEFAGLNMSFFGNEWAVTAAIAEQHDGPVLFLCDDPDLPYPWQLGNDYTNWTICVNAANTDTTRNVLKVPTEATILDTPFATLLTQQPYAEPTIYKAVYYGRPNGRTKLINQFAGDNLLIAGKDKEWGRQVLPAPEQASRQDWYAQFAVSLALYDNKHAQTGWRTGRAYHALNAGTVVAAPPGNNGLSWAHPVTNTEDLNQLLTANLPTIHHQQTKNANPPFPWKQLGL